MTIRFVADADLNADIVKGVLRREPAIDFRTAVSAGLRVRADLEVLAFEPVRIRSSRTSRRLG